MSKPKFTPGPWTHRFMGFLNSESTPEYWIMFDDLSSLAVVRRGAEDEEYGDDNTLKANADLIAAAPEMYEELKFLIENCVETREREWADGSPYEEEVIKAYQHMVDDIRKVLAKARGEL